MTYFERLTELINEIEVLEKNREGHNSVAFKTWQRKVKRYLKEFFGDESEEYKVFDETIFSSMVWSGYKDEDLRMDFEAYKDALKRTRATLSSYIEETNERDSLNNENTIVENIKSENINKINRIFISHSSKDKEYVELLIRLLEYMGLDNSNILCTSVPGFGIPLSENIFDYLREEFLNTNLHVVFLHSKNYYDSFVSLNEMGAAWLAKSKATSLLLPGFNFSEMSGVVNSQNIAIKIDGDIVEARNRLNELYDIIKQDFNLTKKSQVRWEQNRDEFIDSINAINSDGPASLNGEITNGKISENPFTLNIYEKLVYYCDHLNDRERQGLLVGLTDVDFRNKLITFGFDVPVEHVQKLKAALINRYRVRL